MRIIRLIGLLICLTAWQGWVGQARAEESLFDDVDLEPVKAESFLVTSDVNVRDKPATNGKRLSGLQKGDTVEVIGKVGTTGWLAVRKDDQDLGFVYAPVLVPMIEGQVDGPIKGKAVGRTGARCSFEAQFIEKMSVEGELFQTSDYEVALECRRGSRTINITLPMFITEAPYKTQGPPAYQIGIDVLEIAGDYEEVLSTVLLYSLREQKVTFDSVTMKDFAGTPAVATRPAKNVTEALEAAVAITVDAWNAKVWDKLFEH